jgi:hypothetical protein
MLARRVCALVAAFAACMLIVHDVAAHGVSLDLRRSHGMTPSAR